MEMINIHNMSPLRLPMKSPAKSPLKKPSEHHNYAHYDGLPSEYRKQVFMFIGAILFLVCVAVVMFYNWKMVEPHLTPMVWAVLFALALSPAKKVVNSCLVYSSENTTFRYSLMSITWGTLCFLGFYVFYRSWDDMELELRVSFIIGMIILCTIFSIPMIVERDSLAALLIMLGLTGSVLVFVTAFSKTCYDETLLATEAVLLIIDENQHIIQKLHSTTAFVEIWSHTSYVCSNIAYVVEFIPYHHMILASPQEKCIQSIEAVQHNIDSYYQMALAFARDNAGSFGGFLTQMFANMHHTLSHASDFVISLSVFLSCLFYFLKYEEKLLHELMQISPLSGAQTKRVFDALHEKVVCAISHNLLKASVAFFLTAFTYKYIASISVCWVFSFVASFLEMVPILSCYIIWVPSIVMIMVRDGIYSWAWVIMSLLFFGVYTAIHITISTNVFGDKQNPVIISTSILFGLYAFGVTGIIGGPVLAGVTLVLVDIYKQEVGGDTTDSNDIYKKRV